MTNEAKDWSAARGDKWLANLAGMEATLAPVDEPLLDALKLDQPYRIADIGCGGGATTLEILRRAPAGSVVHGFDISAALIELARTRKPADARGVAFEVADASAAPPPRELYDRLVSRFGIMFFDDPQAAFNNLFRWLAPGGRFAFAAWGRLSENPWMTTVRDVVAERIDVPKTEPDSPGPFRYGDASKFLAVLEQAGFRELAVTEWRGKLAVGGGLTAAQAANFALGALSLFAEMLAEAGDDAVDQVRKSLASRFSEHEQYGIVQMNASVHVVTGVRSINLK